MWIWCLFRLPETKDRTFREIDYLFEESGLHPRKWAKAHIDAFDHVDQPSAAAKHGAEHVEYSA